MEAGKFSLLLVVLECRFNPLNDFIPDEITCKNTRKRVLLIDSSRRGEEEQSVRDRRTLSLLSPYSVTATISSVASWLEIHVPAAVAAPIQPSSSRMSASKTCLYLSFLALNV